MRSITRRSGRRLVALATAALLSLAQAAIADTIHLDGTTLQRQGNTDHLDVTTGTSAVTKTIGYRLEAQQSDGCDVSGTNPGTLLLAGLPVGVTISDGATFEGCQAEGVFQDVTLSVASTTPAGSYPITPSMTRQNGGGTFNVHGNADFVLRVTDGTPPIITETVTPSSPNGDNGWYKTGDVMVSFAVSDPNSAVTSKSSPCDVTATFNTDGGGHSVTCEATSSGGTDSKTVNIKRDVTGPLVAITSHVNGATPTETAITVTGTASDATSRLASVMVVVGSDEYPTTINTSTGTWATATGAVPLACSTPTELTAVAKDNAGNTTSSSTVTVTRDCASIDPVVRDWKDAPAIANELIKSGQVTCVKGGHGKGISAVAHWADSPAGDKELYDSLFDWTAAVKAALTSSTSCSG